MSSGNLSFFTLLAAVSALAASAQGADAKAVTQSTDRYQVVRKIPIPGDGSYDYVYVDEDAHRLYVAHGTEVAVLDAGSGAMLGVVSGLAGVHGISVVPGTGKGRPDALTYDPASRKLFVFNHASGDVTVIDPGTNQVSTTLHVGGVLEFARADGQGNVWVNVEDRSEVVRIDAKSMVVADRYPLAPCEEPRGLALDAKHGRLLVGCSNKLMAVVDTGSGKVVTTLAIGPGVDGTEFEAATGDVFNACGRDGTLWIHHQDSADKYHLEQKLGTQIGARTLALDPSSHRLFLAAAKFGNVREASGSGAKLRPTILPGTFVVLVVDKPGK